MIYKWISAVLAGALATLGIVYARQDPKTITVDGDYIETQKVKDNRKLKAKKGIFGFLKADPIKKAERKRKRVLRKQNK